MATLSEIIYNVKNLRAKGRQSDDTEISDRQYAFIINYYRALLLKREFARTKDVGNAYQTLGDVKLIKADKNECCDINDCIYRTEKQLPEALITSYVGLTNLNKPFQKTTAERVIWDLQSPLTKHLPKWYETNNYIYIVNPPTDSLEIITVRGIFEDPVAANDFKTCGCIGDDCFQGYDFDYPMSVTFLDSIYKMMADAEFKINGMFPKDTTNDTQEAKL
jgi:hypothetical protein